MTEMCVEPLPARSRKVRSPRDYEKKAKWVYVIQSRYAACKIGVSSRPRRRLSALQVSTADDLRLYFQIKPENMTALDLETASLAALKHWRARGEWLNCGAHLAQLAIEKIVAGQGERLAEYLEALKYEEATEKAEREADGHARHMSRLRGGSHPERYSARDAADAVYERLQRMRAEIRLQFSDFREEIAL